MSGLELQRAAGTARLTLPVIFISAHRDDGLRALTLAAGASAFLYEPFEAAKLLEAIRRVVDP